MIEREVVVRRLQSEGMSLPFPGLPSFLLHVLSFQLFGFIGTMMCPRHAIFRNECCLDDGG